MNIQKVRVQIKKLAEDFDLKYNPDWFKYLWISIRHEILTEYIRTCQDPIYQKYGKTIEKRIKNIDKFVNSKDFKNCLKRYGGQVAQKSDVLPTLKVASRSPSASGASIDGFNQFSR